MLWFGTLVIVTLSSQLLITTAEDCPPGREEANHFEAKLHKDLLCSYDYNYRPVKDHKKAVNVYVRFAIKYISFDATEETFSVHSWVAMKWTDEFLTWDPNNYGNISDLRIESHNIWTPRMSLYNANAEIYQSEEIYTTCMLSSNGTVTCVPHVPHSGICRSSLKYWPYDTQSCTMYFGAWMHSGEQVNFMFYRSRPVITDDYQNGPGWKLLKVVPERLPGNYSCCPNETYPMLKYTFNLKRESAGPAALVVIPSVVIVTLTVVSLLLDINDNIRLSLQCFSLLGHFIYITEIGYDIPKHSAETPIILLFIRDSMLVTLACILLTLWLMCLRRRVEPPPMWVVSMNRFLKSGPGKYVVFKEFDPSDPEDKKTLTENDTGDDRSRVNGSSEWIALASVLNSFVFIIFVLTYIVLFCVNIPQDS